MIRALSGSRKRWSLPSAGPRVRGTPSPRGPERAVNILSPRSSRIALSRDGASSDPIPDTLTAAGSLALVINQSTTSPLSHFDLFFFRRSIYDRTRKQSSRQVWKNGGWLFVRVSSTEHARDTHRRTVTGNCEWKTRKSDGLLANRFQQVPTRKDPYYAKRVAFFSPVNEESEPSSPNRVR